MRDGERLSPELNVYTNTITPTATNNIHPIVVATIFVTPDGVEVCVITAEGACPIVATVGTPTVAEVSLKFTGRRVRFAVTKFIVADAKVELALRDA